MDQQQFSEAVKKLTPQQEKVLRSVLAGESDSDIADQLEIQEATVRKHVERIYRAFDTTGKSSDRPSSRSELFALFFKYQPELLVSTGKAIKDWSELIREVTPTVNPFIPFTGRIEDPQQFFGREHEISRVFEVLNSNSSVTLIGEEGIGKSSLLWVICQQAENYLQLPRKPVFLDLNNGVHDEDEFYFALCDKIGIPESKGYRLTRNLQKKKVLLAIDNLGKLIENGFTRQVRDQLRGLAEGRDASLRLILAANEPLDKLFNDSQDNGKTSPLSGICQEEHIHPWDEATMRAFITSRLAKTSVSFTEEEIIQLIQESGGHPRKLMQLCYRTYSQYYGVQ
ncbi:LuxR C-terminal-related transcriptional regulator [Nostoc sp. DedQUE07]|uniref:nSTAND1 domain-containing NTPase n=1 Tax=Nostoc sp. DedQUE07 TaxID=3075392 RepID=UPI002AD55CCD|nr:LuxR C-terminal-related transcriptional regulator [Nostoc sp. DedQUE07]MDZ8131067.1 LuxR C-terminal-related transcriptional regulator [Nostoc sp. DedQUE07]